MVQCKETQKTRATVLVQNLTPRAKHDSPMVDQQAPQHVIHVEHVGHPTVEGNKPIKIENVDLKEVK